MKTLKPILYFVFFILTLKSFAQYNFSSYKLSKKLKSEIVFGIGASNFLGDLGGRDQIGTHYSPIDLEVSASRPCFTIGYKYYIKKWFAVKSNFAYAIVNGDDKKTKETYRNYRNLHFKSSIFEFGSQAEFCFYKIQEGQKYLKSVRGIKNVDYNLYAFIGLGAFHFNPRAKYNGKWYNLQPLGTEGQGIKNGTKKYNRLSIAIPIGIGFQYGINSKFSVGIEYGYRKTFTDYIDDVSTVYFDKTLLSEIRGEIAAALSDPSSGENKNWTQEGEKRGNPNGKDSYMFSTLTLSYKIYSSKFTAIKRKQRSKF